MSKIILAVILCLTGIVGYTHAATFEVYKESVLVATIQLDDPEAVPKLTQILQDPDNVSYKIIWYTFGYQGKPDGSVTLLAIDTLGAEGILIVINWTEEASGGVLGQITPSLGFPGALINANQVAKKVGQVILSLVEAGVELNRIILVGFSLGAHLIGEVGRVVQTGGQSILRIVGIEPANYVNALTPLKSLDPSCATLVLVVHSNPGQYATARSVGDVDVWLNYDTKPTQPNCTPSALVPTLDANDRCSHDRGAICFFESVKEDSIMAIGAVDGNAWIEGQTNDQVITVTLDELPLESVGNFYCSTNGESPFGKGTAGLQPN